MSKRTILIAVMALAMTLSVMAFAAMPATPAPSANTSSPVDGLQIAALYAASNFDQDFDPPYCPIPDSPGCDGG